MTEQHFQYWAAATVFSLVSLTSLTNSIQEFDREDWTREWRWALSVAVVSLAVSAFSCLLHLRMKDKFTGTFMELGAVIVVLGMWCAVLPTLLNAENDLAVGDGIANGNLFFSSWGAFIMAVLLATSHFRKFFEREDDKTLFYWVGFATAGFIVMASASRVWKDDCVSTDDGATCKRTMFAVILGVISGLFGLALIFLRMKMMEQVASVFLLAAWCFGAAYITFDQGPGTTVGTLYFSTWACLFFSLNVAAISIPEMMAAATTSSITEETVPAETPATKPDIDPKVEVEDQELEEVGEETSSA